MYIHIHCTYLQHPSYQHLWLSGHFFFRFLLGGFSHERHATMVHALETKHSEKSEAEIERQKQVRTDPGTTWALFAVYRGLFSPVLYRDYFISYCKDPVMNQLMECHWWVSLLGLEIKWMASSQAKPITWYQRTLESKYPVLVSQSYMILEFLGMFDHISMYSI